MSINQRQLRHINVASATVAKSIPFREDEITYILATRKGYICSASADYTPDDIMTIALNNGLYLNILFRVYDDKNPKLGSTLDTNYYNLVFRTGTNPTEPGAASPTNEAGLTFLDDQLSSYQAVLQYDKINNIINLLGNNGTDVRVDANSGGEIFLGNNSSNRVHLSGVELPYNTSSSQEGYALIYRNVGGDSGQPAYILEPLTTSSSYRGTITAGTDNLNTFVPISVGDYWVCLNTGNLDTGVTQVSVQAGGQIIANTSMATAGDVVNNKFDFVPQIIPSATESTKGVAEIATQAEVTTGTDDTRFVTPLKLKVNTQYVHIEASPASNWTINHGLGRNPTVQCIDSNGSHVVGRIVHNSTSQLTLSFTSAITGTAICT